VSSPGWNPEKEKERQWKNWFSFLLFCGCVLEMLLEFFSQKVWLWEIPTVQVQPPTIKVQLSQALVAHTCNLSYSGGRDQEDCGLKTAQANSS
jgi:hypothetical protein